MPGESELPTKDPVRIVYHTENRTFARLFNESSLDQLKDVVRRKLGLGRETDVSLKQMRPDALLDLEDDDDFQAFCVLLRSSVSVDIKVTVGRSQGAAVLPAVAPRPAEAERPTILSPPKKSTANQSTVRPEVLSTPESSAATKKTAEPSARKRKVSFGETITVTPDKSTERHALAKAVVATSILSETPVVEKPEEPPKKKHKRETKAKDVQPSENVGSPAVNVSSTPKKVKKTASLLRGSKVGMGAAKDDDVPEPPAKRPKKLKKDEGAASKKSSTRTNSDGIDQTISEPSNPVNNTSLQPASEKQVGSKKDVSKTRQVEKTGVCASIPRTSASTTVQSEVAAAILSDYLLRGSEPLPPAPPAKRKSVKKDTKKSAASSSTPITTSTIQSHTLDKGEANLPIGHRPEHVAPTKQAHQSNGLPCPICLEEPFHIRYRCPIVLKGPEAIRERLEEARRTNEANQQSLITELEGLLREPEVSGPVLDVVLPHDVQSHEASPPPNVFVSRTPVIPSISQLSEVIVESRDEGSSSESSDDSPEGRIDYNKESSAPGKQKTPDQPPLPSNDDLDAVIRGPAFKQQDIMGVVTRLFEGDGDKSSDSEEDSEIVLEEDQDEEIDRSRRRLSKHTARSSDSETEEEESNSSSPSPPATDNSKSGVQGSGDLIEKFTERHNDDVVMRDCGGPGKNGKQDDDGSEETHVGSEDRMVVDDASGGKGVAAIVEKQPPSNALIHEPHESEQSKVDSASNQDSTTPVVSQIPEGAEDDPIEPEDDLEYPTSSHSPTHIDPIEAPTEDIGSLFSGLSQSTPNPGVTKRIKTRNGQILADDAERPVLLEQLSTETMEATPLPTKAKSRRRVTEPASQELGSVRRTPRFSAAASTPAAVALLNHRTKVGTRSGKATKTPGRPSTGSSAKDNNAQNRGRAAPSSVARWETLAEPPSSPSLHLNEPSVVVDELMSSPHPEVTPSRGRSKVKEAKGRPQKPPVESSQERERLFDLSASQVPFPYSQRKINPAPSAFLNGEDEREVSTDLEEVTVTKKKAKTPAHFRSLSQLTADAELFPFNLPLSASKPATNGKTKKRLADKDSSSSSSSEDDEDEANRSEHIPRGKRAGSALEAKKRKSLLSRI